MTILVFGQLKGKAGFFGMRKWILIFFAAVSLTVTAQAATPEELTAVGKTVGIQLQEQGITITGFVEGGCAEGSGLRAGDRILRINGTEVTTAADIGTLTASGGPIRVTVERDGSEAEYLLTPVLSEGRYLLGLRIRDSISGIGTVTFYDPETGAYGALGHGVCASGSKDLVSIAEGKVVPSKVTGVERGQCGAAGQLLGEFEKTVTLGNVERNTDSGIFGQMAAGQSLGGAYPVADLDAVHTGDAVILSNVSGTETQEYDVKILKIYPGEQQRNLLLEVTDPVLLDRTGGIVQGMSGSPILQDGKLVGAVTHVFVNDQTRGYGIFAENMQETASSLEIRSAA